MLYYEVFNGLAVLKLKWDDLQGKDLEGILKVLSNLSEVIFFLNNNNDC